MPPAYLEKGICFPGLKGTRSQDQGSPNPSTPEPFSPSSRGVSLLAVHSPHAFSDELSKYLLRSGIKAKQEERQLAWH